MDTIIKISMLVFVYICNINAMFAIDRGSLDRDFVQKKQDFKEHLKNYSKAESELYISECLLIKRFILLSKDYHSLEYLTDDHSFLLDSDCFKNDLLLQGLYLDYLKAAIDCIDLAILCDKTFLDLSSTDVFSKLSTHKKFDLERAIIENNEKVDLYRARLSYFYSAFP